jgi:hypothetical protein
VLDVVTDSVVDAPGASVAVVEPDEANAIDVISGTEDIVSVAVADALPTFFTVKRFVNVRADGTVPKTSESESTLPDATGVDVPAWTALPGVTEKWLES